MVTNRMLSPAPEILDLVAFAAAIRADGLDADAIRQGQRERCGLETGVAGRQIVNRASWRASPSALPTQHVVNTG